MQAENGSRPIGTYAIHHVNLVTARLSEMTDFYMAVLNLEIGKRPPFLSTGAWLYAGDQPIVHLVEGAPGPRGPLPQIEHFGLAARGLDEFETVLRGKGVPYRASAVPGIGWPILNLTDPDGNKVEIVFPHEAPTIGTPEC
jgi:catechol 2,3-dioxygenase-like lactoylglutathione lyase family enzyme